MTGWVALARTLGPGLFDRSARRRLGLALAAGTVASACGVALLGASAWLISRAAEQPPILLLLIAIVAVRAFGLGRGVFRYIERLLAHDAALRALARLRVRVFERLAALAADDGGTARARRTVELRSTGVRDVDALPEIVLRVVLPTLAALIVAAGTALAIGLVLPWAGLAVAGATLIAVVVVPWVTARAGRSANRRIVPARTELAVAVDELVTAAPDLLAYGADQRSLAAVTRADRQVRAAEARSAWSAGFGQALVLLAVGVAAWAALAMGISAVESTGMPTVLLAVVALTPLALLDVFAGLPGVAAIASQAKAALSRVADIVAEPDPAYTTEPALTAEPATLPPGPHHLSIRGLAARWDPDGPDVFRGLDLELSPGGRVAVTGPSGTGKSTLAQVLVGFLRPTHGQVLLDGVDVTRLRAEELRRVISWCEQQPHIFDTTVAENVRLARPAATDAEVRAVLGRVRLLDWVEALPAGLNTAVGEHGARLSGGERQRLALARCLLADTPIVVLDEPTEHLDDDTAAALTRELLAASHDRSVLLITHRRADLADVDAVLSMDDDQSDPIVRR